LDFDSAGLSGSVLRACDNDTVQLDAALGWSAQFGLRRGKTWPIPITGMTGTSHQESGTQWIVAAWARCVATWLANWKDLVDPSSPRCGQGRRGATPGSRNFDRLIEAGEAQPFEHESIEHALNGLQRSSRQLPQLGAQKAALVECV
jgi:hypothetical protein